MSHSLFHLDLDLVVYEVRGGSGLGLLVLAYNPCRLKGMMD